MKNSYEKCFLWNLNHLIIRDVWMVKISPYLISPYKLQFLFIFQYLCPKIICLTKLKNDINYIKYKFSHRFGKVCRWLNMYYSNIIIIIIFEIKTMSIWIILKNLLWTYKGCNFCQYWATRSCIHLIGGENIVKYIKKSWPKKSS